MPRASLNDPFLETVADRIREVVTRQPGHRLETVADGLGLPPEPFRRLIEQPHAFIDTPFLIEVIAALVVEAGVDPNWLLTGRYDGAVHREALTLGQERTPEAMRRVRAFVGHTYRDARSPSPDPFA